MHLRQRHIPMRRRRAPAAAAAAVALALAIALGAVLGGLAGCRPDQTADNPRLPQPPPPSPPASPPPVPCPACGALVPAGSDLGSRALAVLVDNFPDARPQAGLLEACLVFEVPAEYGITRLIPVYVHGAPARLGPVRSVRHYMLDLAVGLDALMAHCGQSPRAALDIPKLRVADLNAFGYDDYFWRESEREMPHNLYTSVEKLRAAAAAGGLRARCGETSTWPFSVVGPAAVAPGAAPATQLVLSWPFVLTPNVVTFIWRGPESPGGAGTGRYERYVNDEPHTDQETGKVLGARNVVVLFAPLWRIAGDEQSRLDGDLTGGGKAIVLSDGRSVAASWRKARRTAPLELLGGDGSRLTLAPGQTWILVVPKGTPVNITAP